jgi:polyphosphate kinase 2 (PPK2 family)
MLGSEQVSSHHAIELPSGLPSERVVVLLEGRDGAGKTTTARDVALALGPSICRIVSLPAPSEVERRGVYFDRWLAHLPGPESVVLFDRSWYNRALVERVMGYSAPGELEAFFEAVPSIEEDLVHDGHGLVKVFFTIGRREQIRRLEERRARGSLSVVDAEAIRRRDDYARAEKEMFERTSTELAPWIVLPECDRAARCAAVLEQVRAAARRVSTETGSERLTLARRQAPA